MKSPGGCIVCGSALTGRQRRFCSRACKNKDTNARHQSYANQQARGIRRKRALVEIAGGRCSRCGYRKNLAALTWHHASPAQKSFTLDVRSLSNRSQGEIDAEIAKCVLLCANCHAEVRFPDLDLMATGSAKENGRRSGR